MLCVGVRVCMCVGMFAGMCVCMYVCVSAQMLFTECGAVGLVCVCERESVCV